MSSRNPVRMDVDAVSAAIDAIYVFASDPDNWEEMTDLLANYAGAEDNPEHAALMQELENHAERAEGLAERLHMSDARSGQQMETLFVGFAPDGRVVTLSADAGPALESFCVSPLQSGKPCPFDDAGNVRALRAAIARALSGGGGTTDLLRLSDAEGRERVVGFLAPFTSVPKSVQMQCRTGDKGATPAVLLLMPSGQNRAENADSFQAVLGLSPAEARLAFELRNGMTLKEASAALGISANTARNQLHRIFERLGVNRQVDLVRHLSEMIAIAALLDEGSAPEIDGFVSTQEQPPHERLVLPDGRVLAYRQFGDPDGQPVVLMISSLRSSLGWPPESQAARELGIRLIVPERPGIGFSDVDPQMTLQSVAEDTRHLVDSLGLETIALSARSSGAPFALATAALMGDRVARVVLAAPRLDVPQGKGNRTSMLDYFFIGLRRHPWLLKSSVAILRAKVSRGVMRQLALHFFEKSPVDYAVMQTNADVMENSVDAAIESFWVTYEGLFRESQLYLDGIEIETGGLTAPVEVWQGREDSVNPVDQTRACLAFHGITPAAHHVLDGQGHLFMVTYYRKLLEAAICPR